MVSIALIIVGLFEGVAGRGGAWRGMAVYLQLKTQSRLHWKSIFSGKMSICLSYEYRRLHVLHYVMVLSIIAFPSPSSILTP